MSRRPMGPSEKSSGRAVAVEGIRRGHQWRFRTRLCIKSELRKGQMGGRKMALQRVSCPLLFLILFLGWSTVEGNADGKVEVALYYETLCPYCSTFIVNALKTELFTNGLVSIVDLKLLPYGNARVGLNATITCQHGPSECLLNTVEACAIDIWPKLSEHFPLINCIEELVHDRNYTYWESCFDQLGMDATAVSDCYTSGRGKELELEYAAKTNALQPPHQYVPWVVVNGEPLYDDYENFVSYVCKAYSGASLPEACNNSSANPASLMMSTEKANEVCHRTETSTTAEILPRVELEPALVGWM